MFYRSHPLAIFSQSNQRSILPRMQPLGIRAAIAVRLVDVFGDDASATVEMR
ncbi:hypothetical protein [Microcystis aeruginosa]|uniref:hypothetical protein n=1 Tax=Microcystis aeruginosa TaxID=1126 RepID=UPI00132FC1FB|nr:hypothetical protein [Microcystis aeruginosa]